MSGSTERPVVSAVRCGEYDQQALDRAVERLFADTVPEGLFAGRRVVIKPNLLMKRAPDEATTTHPGVVIAVVRALKRRGAERILLAESPAGQYNAGRLRGIYESTGMTRAAEKEGFELNFDLGVTQTECPEGARCRSFPIIDPMLRGDLLVNICKLKTHSMATLSGAVKNLFGCVPGLQKPELHCRFPEPEAFAEMLVDLCGLMKPTLSVCDAVVAMEGNGPSGGSPKKVGALLASRSPYALDVAACALIDIEPGKVKMLANAMERGLCPKSLDAIELRGDEFSSMLVPDFVKPASTSTDFAMRVPRPFRGVVKKIWTPRPQIRKKDCVGCGRCAESCPQHTIEIEQKKAKIDYSRCIRCYCCHEMCPVKAIDIRRFRAFDL